MTKRGQEPVSISRLQNRIRRDNPALILLCIVFLVWTGLRVCAHLESGPDIGLYDETGYLGRGLRFFKHRPDPSWAPLYSLWYWGLSHLVPDAVDLHYQNWRILAVVPPVLLFCALVLNGATAAQALAAGFVFAIAMINLPVWPRVGNFAALLCLIGLILIPRIRSHSIRYQCWAVLCLLIAFCRPEFILAFGVMAAYTIWQEMRNRGAGRGALSLIIFFAVCALLVRKFGLPGFSRDPRFLTAFSQHFARNVLEFTGGHGSAYRGEAAIVQPFFGDVRSVSQALLSNTPAFIWHVGRNLIRWPGIFISTFAAIPEYFPLAIRSAGKILLPVTLLGAYLSGFRFSKLRIRRKIASMAPEMAAYSAMTAATLASVVFIYPREHYLVVLFVLLLALPALLCRPRALSKWCAPVLAIVLGLFVYRLPSVDESIASFPAWLQNQGNLRTIQSIRDLHLEMPVPILMKQGGFLTYLPKNYKWVDGGPPRGMPLSIYVQLKHIKMIIVNTAYQRDARYLNNSTWDDFTRGTNQLEFVPIDPSARVSQVYVSRYLLPSGAATTEAEGASRSADSAGAISSSPSSSTAAPLSRPEDRSGNPR